MSAKDMAKRLATLEQKSHPKGAPFIVIYNQDDDHTELSPEAWAQKRAAAAEQAGLHGTVICVEYVPMPLPGEVTHAA